uniref:Putative ovule protein n=1 Tax=Solanum chacoense TaxID=4108 RepID=A0A0V0HEA5_SOLCH
MFYLHLWMLANDITYFIKKKMIGQHIQQKALGETIEFQRLRFVHCLDSKPYIFLSKRSFNPVLFRSTYNVFPSSSTYHPCLHFFVSLNKFL